MMNGQSNANSQTQASPSGVDIESVLFNEKLRYLKSNAVVVVRSTPVEEVLAKMRETRAGGALITEDLEYKNLVGIFTERDYLDKIVLHVVDLGGPIEKYMTTSPRTLSPDSTVGDAIRFMTEGGYRHVPLVQSDGALFGLISVRELVEFIGENFPDEVCNQPPRLHQTIDTQEGG